MNYYFWLGKDAEPRFGNFAEFYDYSRWPKATDVTSEEDIGDWEDEVVSPNKGTL